MAEFLVQVKNRFRIGVGPEAMPFGGERLAVALMIVNLAIERDPDSPVLVGHRLVPRLGQIDDTEAAMGEHDTLVATLIEAAVVRTTVHEGVSHSGGDESFV